MKSGMIGLLLFSTIWCGVATAKDIKIDPVNYGLITQKQFDDFILDLGTAISFTPMSPAKTLGTLGFDVSGEVVVSDLSDRNAWKYLVEGNKTFQYLPVPRLHVQKGLPFGMDIGGMLVAYPDSNVRVWGLEFKKGLIKEGALLPIPAVSARVSYSKLEGVDDIDLNTFTVDLLASKDFLMFTPYAGLSYLSVDGREQSSLVTLNEVKRNDIRGLAGLQFSPFPLCTLGAEVVFGKVPQYGLKAGLRF